MAEKAKVLVVANRTAESPELLSALRARHQEGPVEYTLLVPATPQGVSWAADMHSGGAAADDHLEHLADNLRREGVEVTGAMVGDADALAAVSDATHAGDYDEVIVSTLPLRLSKWLKVDLPHKVEHATGLPVRHVVGSDERVTAS
jgi:hypothetical protein